MKCYTGLVVLFLVTTPDNLYSQTGSDIFPELQGWNKPAEPETYYPYNLWDIIDGAADSYLYYEFKELLTGEYTRGDSLTIRVDMFQHKDTYNTYGIYSLERSPDMKFIKIGAEGYQYDGILNFFIDDYYIKISSHNKGAYMENTIYELAGKLSDKINPNPKLPTILSCFPEKNQKPHSKLYSSISYMGMEFLHSIFTAEYTYNEELSFVLFISAPGSKNEIVTMVNQYTSFCKYDGDISENKIVALNDPYNGAIYLAYTGYYLIGTAYLNDAKSAAGYIQEAMKKCNIMETSGIQ